MLETSPATGTRQRTGDKPSLVGHVARRAGGSARRDRRPRAPDPHAGRPALALALRPRRHRFRGDDQRLEGPPRRARRALHPVAARDRHRAGLRGRHAEMAAALPAARRRTAGRDRDGLHPRGGARHALPVEPGRLHALLQLLPHRHAEARAQPDRRGDRRPDPPRPRPPRRLSRAVGRRRASPCPRPAGSSPTS